NSANRDALLAWKNDVRASYPNQLLYTNNYGGQLTDAALGDLASRVHPDLMSFDTYQFTVGSQPTGGQPWNFYSDMWRWRYFSMSNGVLQGIYRQMFHDDTIRDASESEMRLQTF